LESHGFNVIAHHFLLDAFASPHADAVACAVVDDEAIDDWKRAFDEFRRFAKPVIVLVTFARAKPELPGVSLLAKPFLGEPLIKAVRNAVAGTS
jgi:hypothetical protein